MVIMINSPQRMVQTILSSSQSHMSYNRNQQEKRKKVLTESLGLETKAKLIIMTKDKMKSHNQFVPNQEDKISPNEQEKDIKESLTFIEKIGAATKDWVMCYPYGAYNNTTLTLLQKYQASAAITTEARIANLTNDNPFELPRLDTNDFPQ